MGSIADADERWLAVLRTEDSVLGKAGALRYGLSYEPWIVVTPSARLSRPGDSYSTSLHAGGFRDLGDG